LKPPSHFGRPAQLQEKLDKAVGRQTPPIRSSAAFTTFAAFAPPHDASAVGIVNAFLADV
jgi:hypothetical protein